VAVSLERMAEMSLGRGDSKRAEFFAEMIVYNVQENSRK
jgi:hypothetical protein